LGRNDKKYILVINRLREKEMKTIKIIFIAVLYVLILSSVKKATMTKIAAKAIEPYCFSSQVSDDDNSESIKGLGGRERVTRLVFQLGKTESDVILGRSIYDGSKWIFVNSDGGDSWSDSIVLRKKFYEAKDFAVAGGWWYRNAEGVVKEVVCRETLSVYNREVMDFGSVRLQYPNYIQETKVIKGSGKYIYGFLPGQATWTGWNRNVPSPEEVNGDWNFWSWKVVELPQIGGAAMSPRAGVWGAPTALFYAMKRVTRDYTRFTLRLSAPTFKQGEGNGSYANYNFQNMIVFSRNEPRVDTSRITLPKMSTGLSGSILKNIVLPKPSRMPPATLDNK